MTAYPCGGADTPSSSRTPFPLSGGPVQLNLGHVQSRVQVVLALGDAPTGDDFVIELLPTLEQQGPEDFCLGFVGLPEGVRVEDGANATLQVVTNGDPEGGLYNVGFSSLLAFSFHFNFIYYHLLLLLLQHRNRKLTSLPNSAQTSHSQPPRSRQKPTRKIAATAPASPSSPRPSAAAQTPAPTPRPSRPGQRRSRVRRLPRRTARRGAASRWPCGSLVLPVCMLGWLRCEDGRLDGRREGWEVGRVVEDGVMAALTAQLAANPFVEGLVCFE